MEKLSTRVMDETSQDANQLDDKGTRIESPKMRSFLLGLGALIGAAGAEKLLGGNAMSVAMAYQSNNQRWQTSGRLFTQKQLQQLRDICQLVIPKTGTAGAGDVDTHGFIDNQLVRCHANWQQIQVVELLKRIESAAIKRFGTAFSDSSESEQLSLLTSIEEAENEFGQDDAEHFAFLKQMIVFGYFTSEVGATHELAYLPVPGGFTGSIPYSSVGKLWSGGM